MSAGGVLAVDGVVVGSDLLDLDLLFLMTIAAAVTLMRAQPPPAAIPQISAILSPGTAPASRPTAEQNSKSKWEVNNAAK